MMEYLITLAAVAVLGYMVGWKMREVHAKRVVKSFENHMREVAEEVQRNVVQIRITREGEQFLIHNEKTGEFLVQGSTHQEITDRLNERFPNILFMADKDNLREMGYQHDTI